MPTPKLTDIETKSFYQQMLSQVREQRIQNQSRIINTVLFIVLMGAIGAWLWWKRQNRLSKEEKERQHKEFEKYLTEKAQTPIETLQDTSPMSAYSTSNLITNLPSYENEFELVHSSYKSV